MSGHSADDDPPGGPPPLRGPRAGRALVRIDPEASTAAGGLAGLDAEQHFLEGDPEGVARYVLVLDTINFGSGRFRTLNRGSTVAMTERLTAHARRRGGP